MRPTILIFLAGIFSIHGAPRTPRAVALDNLPLFYETNLGQFAPEVKYLSRGQRFSLALTDSAALVGLPGEQQLRLAWEGATPQPALYGQWDTGGASNYFRGESPSDWFTGARHFGRVRYASLYPGIDLVFYGSRTRPEFDFIVAPKADWRKIRIRVHGAKKLRLERDGTLAISLKTGIVRLGAPDIYQPCASGVCPVSGRYRLAGKDLLTFEVADYNPALPLVIDPTLTAGYLGGSGVDIISAVAMDTLGNIYVTGYTTSTNFPIGGTPYKNTLTAGDSDAFVVKLNPSMSTVMYATYLGGPFADYGRAIAVDTSGAAYITGSTIGRYPVTAAAFRPQSAASPAIFVTKLNADGATLGYSTYLDGAGAGQGIAVDTSGQAYIAGWTYTATFTTSAGAYQRAYLGNNDAFVVKMNSTGTAQVYSTFLGGTDEDQARAIAINTAGEAFVAGFTSSVNFPSTPGAYRTAYSGATDGFVARLSAAGTSLAYSTFLGASGVDRANAIAIDATGNAYVAGETLSGSFPVTAGAYQQSLGGSSDAFVSKLNPTGTGLVYSTFLGGSGTCSVSDPFQTYRCDGAYGIAVNASGQAYVTGVAGASFPQVGSTQTFGGNGDAFLTQLNSSGTLLVYSSYLGGSVGDTGRSLALNGTTVVLGGVTASTDVPLTASAAQTSSGGGTHDGLLGRFGDCQAVFLSQGSNFPASAGNYPNIAVSAPANCSWTVSSGVPWATLTNASGTGNGQFTLNLTQNTGCVRTAMLTLPGGSTYTMTQSHTQCAQFSPPQSWFPASGGNYQIQIWSYLPTTTWNVYSLAGFATVSNGLGRTGSGAIDVTLAPNTGVYRTGYLYLDPFGMFFRIDQIGGAAPLTCGYALSPGEQFVDRQGISGSFLVSTQADCGWTAITAAPWVTLTSASGSGEGVVGYEVAVNTTGQLRSATINVGGQSFTITQSAQ